MARTVPIEAAGAGPGAHCDFVLPALAAFRAGGERTALVTLVGIEASSPRPLGAQMAVSETGEWIGYISGGCLEGAVAAEACLAIAEGQNRIVRYGSGSPYLDIRLPCGGGLDLHFNPALREGPLYAAIDYAARRIPFEMRTQLDTGETVVVARTGVPGMASSRDGDLFRRVYAPALRLLIAGQGPAADMLVRMTEAAGYDVALIEDAGAIDAAQPDPWSAFVTLFHDHDREVEFLAQALTSNCLYVGAMGSAAAKTARETALRAAGVPDEAIARLRSPVGLIPLAKSPSELAVSVLGEIVAVAKGAERLES